MKYSTPKLRLLEPTEALRALFRDVLDDEKKFPLGGGELAIDSHDRAENRAPSVKKKST